MRVVAVGGAGFLGRHAVDRLVAAGTEVVTVDRTAPARQVTGEEVLRHDLLSPGGPEKAAVACGVPDAVVWLAAPSRHRTAVDGETAADLALMVEAPVRFLYSLRSRPRSFVYLSSIQVYGKPASQPITEDHPTDPFTSYGVAKLCAEKYLEIAAGSLGFSLTALRVSFIYGPGQHPANAIPVFLRAVRRGEAPVIRGSGQEQRDDVYVADVARAIELAIHNSDGGVINIASGRTHTLLEVAQEACRLGRAGLRPIHEEADRGWVDRAFSVARAKAVLGFESATPFRDGLRAQWRSLGEGG